MTCDPDILTSLRSVVTTGGPLAGFFEAESPVHVARAPGRLDLMGGFADYSGSLVLQWPLAEATVAAVQETTRPGLRIATIGPAHDGAPIREVWLDTHVVSDLTTGDYDAAHGFLTAHAERVWAAYVVGPLLVLSRHAGRPLPDGLAVLVGSTVPESKGVSSSAAVEVAVMQAAAAAFGVSLAGADLARLCQVAENHVVGAPCGIMDQTTSALGRAHHLLALRCQPAEVDGFPCVPDGLGVWGIDSGVRHAVSGSDYTAVRVGAFMGYRVIADLAGFAVSPTSLEGMVTVDDPRWKGYLANVSPALFESDLAPQLPETMSGAAFLSTYGGTTDPVTRVDPQRAYAVAAPTAHPIYENARVERFRALLGGEVTDDDGRELGALMYASHIGYSRCGLGCKETDRLVDLVRTAPRETGLFGAKITGGGSGGTVAILGRADAASAVTAIAERYREETGFGGYVFAGSSDGSVACGTPVIAF